MTYGKSLYRSYEKPQPKAEKPKPPLKQQVEVVRPSNVWSSQ